MMMTNLFSIFDPSLSMFSFSWFSSVLIIFILPSFYWFAGNFYSYFYSFLNFMKSEVEYSLASFKKSNFMFIGSIFLTIFVFNFLALFPFIFSLTSHLLVTFPLSYVFWVSIILFTWSSSFSHFLSHLIPVGTPVFLMSFMVIVEVLSNLIRPLALTFRLTANMMAGHLLMSLIGSALISLPFSITLLFSLLQSLLVFMELGVSLIQSYVFSTLLLLYLSEAKSH